MKSLRFNAGATLRTLSVLAAASTFSLSSHALLIVATYDANVSAGAQAAFQFAINEFEAAFTDAVTVNVNVNFGNTGLGGSSTALQFVVPDTYAQVRTALIVDQTAHSSASGATSVGAGGSVNTATDPTAGGRFLYTRAQAKALGALPANLPGSDGTITFSNVQSFTLDPNNRGSGGFDFIGVAEHEISEVMGRIPGLGGNFCGSPSCGPDYLVYDLFRFSGAGTRVLSDAAGVSFSIDNGSTLLHGFNFANGNGSDPQDWDSSDPTDPFNAFTGPNQAHSLNAVDYDTLDVIGWDRAGQVTSVPEPASLGIVFLSLFGMSAATRRACKRS